VSCRKQLQQEREQKIYWYVIGNEVYGTTTASKASTFYVQCKEEQFCHIIHKTPELGTRRFSTVQRPFDTERPLKLVPFPKHEQDICFTLIDDTKQPLTVPQTENEWENKSPFFIKLPAGGVPIIGALNKPMRYISIRKIIEKGSKKKTKSSDADFKVPNRTQASGTTLDFKNGEEESKYTTGSSATLDTDDEYVITMQFYFKPVGNVQGSRVTISSGPLPRIESDSGLGGDELIRQRQEEEDDIRLKQAFIELVGREYVFPLPVRAVDIPDTQQ
jgi:hypothetical protein